MVPETKVIDLTPKHRITLSQITHYQLVSARNKVETDRYASLKPAMVAGYTHELAYENIASYKAQWEIYQQKVMDSTGYVWFGAAWQSAGLDMDDGVWEAQVASATKMAAKLKLPAPNTDDVMDLGALAWALIESRVGPEMVVDLITWLRQGAGLLDASEVEAERKSAEGTGEQPPPVGSVTGNEGKSKKRK